MWPFIAFVLLVVLLVFQRQWRRRRADLERELARTQRDYAELKDLHQQKMAQESAQLQALFNSMIEGVLLLDREGRVRLANQALDQFFNLTNDIRGQTIMEAIRLHELQDLVNRTAATGQVLDFELALAGLDERCLQVNSSVFLDRDGIQQGMILVFHDLTRLKQLENTRKEFVANVSHELRTPLSLIKGFVETLMDGAKDDPAVAMRFLQTIDKHADRLTYLIEDLLAISRLESGQITLNLQQVALHPLTQRVVDDLQSRAADKQVTLENLVPAELAVRADADRLQQVISNLVDNAIKYGKSAGRVVIAARLTDTGIVEFSVADDGPGIPAESINRVFERFYRVDKARSREQGGTGLGLAIVKHIVQSHGGEVRVTSELEQGTTFFFTLPQALPSVANEGDAPSSVAALRRVDVKSL
jgi:two-component system phosphate regulon sensor histidine kinase PhoR